MMQLLLAACSFLTLVAARPMGPQLEGSGLQELAWPRHHVRERLLQETLLQSSPQDIVAAQAPAAAATAAVGGASAPAKAPTVTAEPGMQYFIFGYGSLLERFSRMKTDCGVVGISEFMLGSLFQQDGLVPPYGPDTEVNCTTARDAVLPARVSGVDRGWYAPGSHVNAAINGAGWADNGLFLVPTYLGAFETDDKNSTCNGIIYPVSPEQYALQVKRELMANYTLVELTKDRITQLGGPPLPAAAKVVYFASNKATIALPTARAPIVQSYIDVTMGGALELQDQYNLTKEGGYTGNYPNFVEELVGTTKGWSSFWVNDRTFPYRPFVNSPYAFRINTALFNQLKPDILQKISAVPITTLKATS